VVLRSRAYECSSKSYCSISLRSVHPLPYVYFFFWQLPLNLLSDQENKIVHQSRADRQMKSTKLEELENLIFFAAKPNCICQPRRAGQGDIFCWDQLTTIVTPTVSISCSSVAFNYSHLVLKTLATAVVGFGIWKYTQLPQDYRGQCRRLVATRAGTMPILVEQIRDFTSCAMLSQSELMKV
jgi:hypothetical protein